MKKLKKSLLFLLATSMIMSNTLTSLADNSLEGNVNSGGGTGVGSDSVYTHKFMAYPENQGYRISIVDTFGDRVANSVDIVNYIPSDIYGISYNNSNNGGGRQEFIDGFNQYKARQKRVSSIIAMVSKQRSLVRKLGVKMVYQTLLIKMAKR